MELRLPSWHLYLNCECAISATTAKEITFREVKVRNKVNVHAGPVYRFGFEDLLCGARDKDLRRREWQVIEFCLDPVLRAGSEGRTRFTGKNLHFSWGQELQGDKHGVITIVLDLKAGCTICSYVRDM